eukprot:403370632
MQERQGVQFIYMKRNQLFFVFTSTKKDLIPSFAQQLLFKVVQMIHDFCGGLEEELMRTNFILVYELIDEMIDYGHPQITYSETLRRFVHTQAEKCYNGTMDYLWTSLKLDKIKLTDSISEKDSEKSIQKHSNDVFVEIQEKLSAVFNVSGFAIYIKINGMVLIKNYLHSRLNLRLQMNEEFSMGNELTLANTYHGVSLGYDGRSHERMETYNGTGGGSARKRVQVSQLHETINEHELAQAKMLSIFPPLGQSIALQYSLDGNFQMLPIKLYPSFIPRHNYKKLELTLKVSCRLSPNLRCKFLKVSFQFPSKVHKINFTNMQQDQVALGFKDIKDMDSLNKVATSWIASATSSSTVMNDNGKADCDMKKRKVVWTITNLKGGQSKTLEVCLSYDKDVLIDELQFKQLGPFTLDFDIPNYTASGIKIQKMDAKLIESPFDQNKEPGKWLRHKTTSGSYVSRV